MQRMSKRTGRLLGWALCALGALIANGLVYGDDTHQAGKLSPEQLWRQTVDLVEHGEFHRATDTVRKIETGDRIPGRVRTWLEEFQARQDSRLEMDQADFKKYVEYAKARIGREEYRQALRWVIAAEDCTSDRDAFLASDWIQDLVNDSLTAADGHRQEHKWREAWYLYSHLGTLFEHEPRYQKLEREVLTHLRLDTIFKEGSNWEERIEKARWKDAEVAMEYIDRGYVELADFKEIAQSGLEQMLLLAESKSARDQLEGLANEDDRNDFIARVQEHLDQVMVAPSVDRREAVEHFRRVVKKINAQTVRLPEELVVVELMRGALEPLDDFTTIIWPHEREEFDKHTRGDFVGVGISIIKNRADEIEVVSPLDDTPAYRAGIQAGDIITKADGEELKQFSLTKVVRMITGKEGTTVTLTIRRGDKEIEFPLERARVKIRSVKGIRRDHGNEERWEHWLDHELGVGYIRITNFQGNTVEDVGNALSDLVGLKGLVLDLRGNPGGLLDAACQLSTLFLKRGETIVSTKGRIRHDNRSFGAPGNGPYSDIPLVVLVDERSASASEIVSGAVRDNDRGVVVGERTFGKFSVQNLIPLSRSGAKLKITTARYYLPNGDSLQRDPKLETWGVQPDVPIRLVYKESIKLYEMRREADLLGPPKQPADDEPSGDDLEDESTADEATGDEAESTKDAERDTENQQRDASTEGDEQEPGDDDETFEEPKLPPLEQPDPNERPKADPQLDAALLLMRVTLIDKSFPAHAAAEVSLPVETAQP